MSVHIAERQIDELKIRKAQEFLSECEDYRRINEQLQRIERAGATFECKLLVDGVELPADAISPIANIRGNVRSVILSMLRGSRELVKKRVIQRYDELMGRDRSLEPWRQHADNALPRE
jgi:hypothetical protein